MVIDGKKPSNNEGDIVIVMVKKNRKSTAQDKTPRSRKGLLPGQYRKRSTVYVERLRGAGEEARYSDEDMMRTDAYIVQTNRLDGTFSHTVELNGVMMRLPGKVVERLESQKDAIIKEARSERGKEIAQRLRHRVEADVEDAVEEAERATDLGGL